MSDITINANSSSFDDKKDTKEAVSIKLLKSTETEKTLGLLEAERHRLALELEQKVVESLNLLLAQASMYEQSLADNPMARMAVSVLATLGRQTLQQTRDLIGNLQPTILNDLGLAPALEWLAAQISRVYGLQASFSGQLSERLPPHVELNLFRATQDILAWIVKNAQAQIITIQLQQNEQNLILKLADNGRVKIQATALAEVEQRLNLLNGKLETAAKVGGGSLVQIHLPLEASLELTSREKEVLEYLAQGMSNKQIALTIKVSPRTVNFHLDHIYTKLSVNSRTEAVIQALRRGWL